MTCHFQPLYPVSFSLQVSNIFERRTRFAGKYRHSRRQGMGKVNDVHFFDSNVLLISVFDNNYSCPALI
jgi:hypothetical protein